ncbi:MAG: hypothetical protein OEW21_03455 [Betaproteobacteria bacterium]|nr:hypothetical protein [Betaproteobacteria bacterium]
MDVRFIDTTFRDGAQSLWASNMRTGMIEAVAEDVGRAGFAVIEVPVGAVYFKKFVRDLKEDPWEMARRVARKLPRAVKSCMAGGNLNPLGEPSPRAIAQLFYERIAANRALDRAQTFANTYGQMENEFPWTIPMFRNLGMQVAIGLSYTISPRHTDEYYAQKTRAILAYQPDAIYVEDQGGLLTLDRARTLIPAIVGNAQEVPVELHAHCSTGLAPLVYLEALQMGVATLHTAIPPLAEGPSQPSIFNVARNARLLGHTVSIDEELLRPVVERLTAIAKQDRLPIGAPLEYDCAQYIHHVPGGVISNLRHQLAGLRMEHRLNEVLDESVRVRRDLGYPIMVTPHSQFVVTQSAINVATGERYKHVIDELILFAQGVYGEDSGYTWMDQDLKDRLLGMQRARELGARRPRDIPMREIRAQLGGAGVSDEEFLLRFMMKGGKEVEAMRAAGPPRPYLDASQPLPALLRELSKHRSVRYIHLRRGGDSLLIQNRVSA